MSIQITSPRLVIRMPSIFFATRLVIQMQFILFATFYYILAFFEISHCHKDLINETRESNNAPFVMSIQITSLAFKNVKI
jgi:hypothetical protein